MTAIDRYFNRPIFYDYIIGLIVCFFVKLLEIKNVITIIDNDKTLSLISDLSTISLTLSGFILTFLTVIVTFKTAAKKVTDQSDDFTVLDLFFNSKLYYTTTTLLKGGIKSLVLLAFIGLIFKVTIPDDLVDYLFYFNILWITVISVTMWRNLLILSKIISLQKED